MKTIQMTIDDGLVEAVDRVSKELKTTRSAFTRKALKEALTRYSNAKLEHKHKQGYENNPVFSGEFSDFEDEQTWGDE